MSLITTALSHAYKRLLFSEIGTVCVCHCGHIDVFYENGEAMTFTDLSAAVVSITADSYPEAQTEGATSPK